MGAGDAMEGVGKSDPGLRRLMLELLRIINRENNGILDMTCFVLR